MIPVSINLFDLLCLFVDPTTISYYSFKYPQERENISHPSSWRFVLNFSACKASVHSAIMDSIQKTFAEPVVLLVPLRTLVDDPEAFSKHKDEIVQLGRKVQFLLDNPFNTFHRIAHAVAFKLHAIIVRALTNFRPFKLLQLELVRSTRSLKHLSRMAARQQAPWCSPINQESIPLS